MQHILREKAGVKNSNLYKEIQEVIGSGTLPPHVVQVIDTICDMGNTAVHPFNNPNTGEIVPVGRDDAEWCLEIVEMLHDFYFVLPAENQRRLPEWQQRKSQERRTTTRPLRNPSLKQSDAEWMGSPEH